MNPTQPAVAAEEELTVAAGFRERGMSVHINRDCMCKSHLQCQGELVSPWEHCLNEYATTDLAHLHSECCNISNKCIFKNNQLPTLRKC